MEKFTDDDLQYCMNCHNVSFDWVEDDNIKEENKEGEYNERLCPECKSTAYFTATEEEKMFQDKLEKIANEVLSEGNLVIKKD